MCFLYTFLMRLIFLLLVIICFSLGYAVENNNDNSKYIVLQKLKQISKQGVENFHHKDTKSNKKEHHDIMFKLQRRHLAGQLLKSKLSRFHEVKK